MNVYDFDKTIYNGDSTRDFYFFCLKRHKSILKFLPGQGLHFLRYALGLIDKTKFKEQFYVFLTGIKDIDTEVELFWETHEKKMKTWFPDWRKKDDVLISASPEFLLEPIAKKMNFTLIASRVDKYTGKTTGKNCWGEEKVARFNEKFQGEKILTFFSDSFSDRPLAYKAQMAYLIRGNKAFVWREYEAEHGKVKKKKTGISYDRVCELETSDFFRRFLPYSMGSPEYVPTYSTQYTDQYQRVNLVCFADSHIDGFSKAECVDNVKRTVQFANEAPIEFDALIHAGDIIAPFGLVEKKVALARAKKFFDIAKKSERPFIFAKGNHDLNDWDNLPERVLTDKDWGDLFLNFAEDKYKIKRQLKKSGERSTWHYYDITEKKVRIVAIDIMDADRSVLTEKGTCKLHGGNSWYISNEQMNWVVNEALNFDDKREKDWGVVLTLHMYPKAPAFHANAADVLLDICAAFNGQQTYSHSYKHESNGFFDMEINADFTRYAGEEKKPSVICWLLGHDHERKNFVKKGINIIYIINNSASCICGDPRVARIPGTCTQNSFDVVNIDTKHRKIRVFAYGAKTTCYGENGDRFLPDGLDY